MNIAIIGARGCVGVTLMQKLLEATDHMIIASYRRKENPGIVDKRVEWRRVNLHNDFSTEEFLRGADVLVYLVHSLGAKNFEHLDQLFARRVGKIAKQSGVKKIVYLGGITPKGEALSAHLRSRQETGNALASHGVPVAEVRASILLGACSISYRMIYGLAKRLPILVMPTWSRTKCSPIALEDAVDVLVALVGREGTGHELFEIGSEIMGYDELVMRVGKTIRRKKNRVIHIGLFSIPIAAYAVQKITGISRHVAAALMGSLKNDSAVTDNRFNEVTRRSPKPIDEVLIDLCAQMGR